MALMFPGQGSQAVGMGRDLADAFPEARDVFEEVDSALGEKLSAVIWDGPAETLTMTANAQPALFAMSLAVLRVLERARPEAVAQAAFVAGHSLGEYSALAAAGALSVTDGARLLRLRGEAMQRAVPIGKGAMAALIGKVDLATAEAIALDGARAGVVGVANDNNYGNVVISGESPAVDAALEAAKARGVRGMRLAVSAPFHSALMGPAAEEMRTALANCVLAAPSPPLVANVTARPIADPDIIRDLLLEQVTGRVRWRESVEWMASEGAVQRFIEIGAGRQLSGMVKRTAPDAECVALNTPADIEQFVGG
ncbi:ACP S-malonyltransferase [bacterium]|nr:ACP S-malonyltransferase [bacterium]